MKKPEKFAWDDDPSNDHGWYDSEDTDKYIDEIILVIQNRRCEITESNKNIKQLCRECWRCKALENFGIVDKK